MESKPILIVKQGNKYISYEPPDEIWEEAELFLNDIKTYLESPNDNE